MTAQPQFAVMEWWLVYQHLEPAGLHRPFLSLAVGANASYFQRVLSEAEFFVSASGAIIGPKRDIQKKYFDPTKTEHRPSANDKECYADARAPPDATNIKMRNPVGLRLRFGRNAAAKYT